MHRATGAQALKRTNSQVNKQKGHMGQKKHWQTGFFAHLRKRVETQANGNTNI